MLSLGLLLGRLEERLPQSHLGTEQQVEHSLKARKLKFRSLQMMIMAVILIIVTVTIMTVLGIAAVMMITIEIVVVYND